MTCKFTIESKIGLEPSIAALNQSIQTMGSHIANLTNIINKQQIKHQIRQGRSKNKWRWHLLEWDEWKARIIETNA